MTHVIRENQVQIGHLLLIYLKQENGGYTVNPSWSIQNFQNQNYLNDTGVNADGFTYYYFPFTVSNFSVSNELDGLNAEINVANTSWTRAKANEEGLLGAKVILKTIFLQEDGGADRGESPQNYRLTQSAIERRGIVDSVVYLNAVISLKIQPRISAVDAVIPAESFTGDRFEHLPFRNNNQRTTIIR